MHIPNKTSSLLVLSGIFLSNVLLFQNCEQTSFSIRNGLVGEVELNSNALRTAEGSFNSAFVDQNVPATMIAGHQYEISLTYLNTGSVAWSPSHEILLGSQNPQDNGVWNSGRVPMGNTNDVSVGKQKTFRFTVTAPITPGRYHFQWQLVKAGVGWFGDLSADATVDVFFDAPDIVTNFPPLAAPSRLEPQLFGFERLFGANLLETDNVLGGWFPSAQKLPVLTSTAKNLGLKILRFAIAIPTAEAGVSIESIILATRNLLDGAQAAGIKVILVTDGYTMYDKKCDWKQPFLAIKDNASALIKGVKGHPAIFAWDLLNEPMWGAKAAGCLKNRSDYQSVVDAVHAMYRIIKGIDPNTPTTVGEGGVPSYLKYWSDISSFASPHLYPDLPNASDINLRQMLLHTADTIDMMRELVNPLPLIVGEWGFFGVAGETQVKVYQKFFEVLRRKDVGNLYWVHSLSESQQVGSPIDLNGQPKELAKLIARQTAIVPPKKDGLLCLTSAGAVTYSNDLNTWKTMEGRNLRSILTADLNGDGRLDIIGNDVSNKIVYSLDLGGWQEIPGELNQLIVAGDFDGDGKADLAGLNSKGAVFYTLNRKDWNAIPGTAKKNLITGDFNGDGQQDIVAIDQTDKILLSTNLKTWTEIPGELNHKIIAADVNGDHKADVVGINSIGLVFYTTNLKDWVRIEGKTKTLLAAGDFNGDKMDDLISVDSESAITYSSNVKTWQPVDGELNRAIITADFNGDGKKDLAGINSIGKVFVTTDLRQWSYVNPSCNQLVAF